MCPRFVSRPGAGDITANAQTLCRQGLEHCLEARSVPGSPRCLRSDTPRLMQHTLSWMLSHGHVPDTKSRILHAQLGQGETSHIDKLTPECAHGVQLELTNGARLNVLFSKHLASTKIARGTAPHWPEYYRSKPLLKERHGSWVGAPFAHSLC